MPQTPTQPARPDHEHGYAALEVTPALQDLLRPRMAARYPDFKGNHITLKLGLHKPSDTLDEWLDRFKTTDVEIYGTADDGFAVQCFLVRVNGETADAKGRPYHLTWSVDTKQQAPAEYNDNKKPSPIGSRHAAYVAAQEKWHSLWPVHEVIHFTATAHFYLQNVKPEAAPAQMPSACEF